LIRNGKGIQLKLQRSMNDSMWFNVTASMSSSVTANRKTSTSHWTLQKPAVTMPMIVGAELSDMVGLLEDMTTGADNGFDSRAGTTAASSFRRPSSVPKWHYFSLIFVPLEVSSTVAPLVAIFKDVRIVVVSWADGPTRRKRPFCPFASSALFGSSFGFVADCMQYAYVGDF